MSDTPTRFINLQTCIYQVENLDKAKAWCIDVLEAPPYFDEPFYLGFSVSGYELGLVAGAPEAPEKPRV